MNFMKLFISTCIRSAFVLRDRGYHVGHPFGFTPSHGGKGCMVPAHEERFTQSRELMICKTTIAGVIMIG